MAKYPSILSISRKKTSSFLSYFYHFNPICSSLMSFPCRLVLFTLLQTAFQNTLSASSFPFPTFTVTNSPHLAQADEYCLTHSWAPGKHPFFLSFCTTSLAVTACQSFKSEMTEATLNSHAKLETRGKAQTTVIGICAAEGFFGG